MITFEVSDSVVVGNEEREAGIEVCVYVNDVGVVSGHVRS